MPNGPWKSPADDGESMVFALRHPLRRELLVVFADGVHSPKELAARLREELSLVAYHTRALKFYGVVELVDTRPSRGSTQHFYRATELGRRALELGRSTGMIDEDDGDAGQPG